METSITHPGEQQTNSVAKVPRNQTNFKIDHQLLSTMRFGEYTPHFVAECVPDDKGVKFRAAHNLRTYTLQSPLLSDLSCKKDYFAVPNQAILPGTWDLIYRNPAQGDDVPADANTVVHPSIILKILYNRLTSFLSLISDFDEDDPYFSVGNVKDLFKTMVAWTWICSDGSLLNTLGCSLRDALYFEGTESGRNMYCDDFVDAAMELFTYGLSGSTKLFELGEMPVYSSLSVEDRGKGITLREAWYKMLEQPSEIEVIRGIEGDTEITIQASAGIFNELAANGTVTRAAMDDTFTIDIARIFAYNLVCAHYYTNDHIDYIYSADLYRQLISSYCTDTTGSTGSVDVFSYNGTNIPYDWCSGHYVDKFFTDFNLLALSNIFNFNRSLKYVDYFTGGKSRPLAVGDTDVSVVGGKVSVVDVTRNIQRQRFLNAVNRAGSKFENYVKTLFGVKPAYDYHNPAFLAHTADDVRGVENENTGAAQMTAANSVTSVYRSNAEKFMFETEFDRPTILIGITYYDIPRAYMGTIERPFFYKDRFDSFIPEMQFVGDQPIYQGELGVNFSTQPFAYETRYQEYKLRPNRAIGGFRKKLRSWAYVNNSQSDIFPLHISPNFIRSNQSDLDEYYLVLTGYSLSSYFHFIVQNNNYFEADRPMVAKPQIL